MVEPTVYELSVEGRSGDGDAEPDVPQVTLPQDILRADNGLPEISQLDSVRHFQALAQANFGVDSGFYPLGSCTMKYNPKSVEDAAHQEGYTLCHPLQNPLSTQGNLALMHGLQSWLAEIGGFAAVSLQPAAGAHGELSALLMMRAYHGDRGESQRNQVIIPDSAHGTNPASTTMAGFDVLEVPSDERGNVDLNALRAACDDTVAGLMLTNPNTLGLFEEKIERIIDLVHSCGGLVYGDGANMNALAGIARPGDLGIDLMHFNLHKTFATPHGGGGPGSGPVGASEALAPYLPGPIITALPENEDGEIIYLPHQPEKSIGRMCAFHGSFSVFVRAYAYLCLHGAEGLRQNSMHAVLNANYLRALLRDTYPAAFDRLNMHEFVCQGRIEGTDVRAVDICKRLMDYGIHPPTSYFPLTVPEALMIEPTETESKQTLDTFAEAMLSIAEEARQNPDLVRTAPHSTVVGRLDEAKAAKQQILSEYPSNRQKQ